MEMEETRGSEVECMDRQRDLGEKENEEETRKELGVQQTTDTKIVLPVI